MPVVVIVGCVILLAGIVMGLAQSFIYFLPYSIYFTLFVMVVVGIGIYVIHRSGKENN